MNKYRYFCKNNIRFITTFLAPVAMLVLCTQLSAAPQSQWQGHLTSLTPFDLKVIGSGFYQMTVAPRPTNQLSLRDIFSVAATFHYRLDSPDDDWQSPRVTELNKSGDCEDMALWVYEKLKENGYAGARIMVGKFEATDARFHTWAVCSAPDGDDYIVDPALQTRIWKRSELLPEVYLPSYSFDGENKYSHGP